MARLTRIELFTTMRNAPGHRVAIALRWKGLDFVAFDAGAGVAADRPQGLLPFVRIDGQTVAQSLTIIELLEDLWPEPAILPRDPVQAARAKSVGQYVASEVHAVNMSNVHAYLADDRGWTSSQRSSWYAHWIKRGLAEIESMAASLRDVPGPRFAGWPLYVAIVTYPQLCNARRNRIDLAPLPQLNALLMEGDVDRRFGWPPVFVTPASAAPCVEGTHA